MNDQDSIAHGTYLGYNAEQRRGIEHCDDCRAARAKYMKLYRHRKPDTYERNNRVQFARNRALRRLAAQHPEEMQLLYDEELHKDGLV